MNRILNKKMNGIRLKTAITGVLLVLAASILGQTATEIMQKSENMYRGSSSRSQMSMTIMRPEWQRTVSMKSWSKGDDYSLV